MRMCVSYNIGRRLETSERYTTRTPTPKWWQRGCRRDAFSVRPQRSVRRLCKGRGNVTTTVTEPTLDGESSPVPERERPLCAVCKDGHARDEVIVVNGSHSTHLRHTLNRLHVSIATLVRCRSHTFEELVATRRHILSCNKQSVSPWQGSIGQQCDVSRLLPVQQWAPDNRVLSPHTSTTCALAGARQPWGPLAAGGLQLRVHAGS